MRVPLAPLVCRLGLAPANLQALGVVGPREPLHRSGGSRAGGLRAFRVGTTTSRSRSYGEEERRRINRVTPLRPSGYDGTVSRMLEVWETEYAAWQVRDLSEVDYVYVWADGVHLNVRLGEQDRLCLLVMIGVAAGRNEGAHRGLEDGYRESTESWARRAPGPEARRGHAGARAGHRRRSARLLGGGEATSGPRRANNGTGCTGWATSWTSCPSGFKGQAKAALEGDP